MIQIQEPILDYKFRKSYPSRVKTRAVKFDRTKNVTSLNLNFFNMNSQKLAHHANAPILRL